MNSLKPPKMINGKTTVGGGIALSVLAVLAYMVMGNTASIERVSAKGQTTSTDVAEVKKDVRHIRETLVLVCDKLELRGCRRR